MDSIHDIDPSTRRDHGIDRANLRNESFYGSEGVRLLVLDKTSAKHYQERSSLVDRATETSAERRQSTTQCQSA